MNNKEFGCQTKLEFGIGNSLIPVHFICLTSIRSKNYIKFEWQITCRK